MKETNYQSSFDKAKKVDLVDLLSRHGQQPVKIRGNDYWYLSPLRKEKTASFKINRAKNVWYDHGLGKGGGVIDFAILFYNCQVSEAVDKLSHNLPFHQAKLYDDIEKQSTLKIISQSFLTTLSLLKYLNERRIAEHIAAQYCKEVCFGLNDKQYRAIGFKNNEGGFELRNSWFKGSSQPKTFTSLENGYDEAYVFEGFFDFLSFQTFTRNQQVCGDYLILNSTSFFDVAKPWMEQHKNNQPFPGQWCNRAKAYSNSSQLGQ